GIGVAHSEAGDGLPASPGRKYDPLQRQPGRQAGKISLLRQISGGRGLYTSGQSASGTQIARSFAAEQEKSMKTPLSLLLLPALPLAVTGARPNDAPDAEYLVYFGTYTGFTFMFEGLPAGSSHSKGIYLSRFRPATGEVSRPELAAEIVNPA